MALRAECNPEGTQRKWSSPHCSPGQSLCRYEMAVGLDTSVAHMLRKNKPIHSRGCLWNRLQEYNASTIKISMVTAKNQSLACELLRAANLASLVKSNLQVAYTITCSFIGWKHSSLLSWLKPLLNLKKTEKSVSVLFLHEKLTTIQGFVERLTFKVLPYF